ncbi:hypothetical protein ABZ896_06070 [Streptomyces sp. NPDC047072]|uniref:hypothetical protein n=1 Tax=Streptomyces sp. NPDC047072 TaxID=3154809 RepID=UPI0033F6C05D
MTRDDDTRRAESAQAEAETEAMAQLRHALSARFRGRPLPPDLVVTTRTDIENREFKAYAAGWRDRVEHEERRRTQPPPQAPVHPRATDATVLPFPHSSTSSSARPHPHDDPS